MMHACPVRAAEKASDGAAACRDDPLKQQLIHHFFPMSLVCICLQHPLSFSGTSPDTSLDPATQSSPGEVSTGGCLDIHMVASPEPHP